MYSLLNNSSGFTGIYRGKILEDGNDIRVYIPGIHNTNPLNKDGSVNSDVFESNKEAYPIAQWCAYNLQSCTVDQTGPAWIMFENGDINYPVVLSYEIIGSLAGGDGTIYSSLYPSSFMSFKEYKKFIVIGDSRTVQLVNYLFDNGSKIPSNECYICLGGMAYKWFSTPNYNGASEGVSSSVKGYDKNAKKSATENWNVVQSITDSIIADSVVVMLMGANEGGTFKYADLLNKNVPIWNNKGADVYFFSCGKGQGNLDNKIQNFNKELKNYCNNNSNVYFYDLYNEIQNYVFADDAHYKKETYEEIHEKIISLSQTIEGEGVIPIKGALNDSRKNITNVEDAAQCFTYMNYISSAADMSRHELHDPKGPNHDADVDAPLFLAHNRGEIGHEIKKIMDLNVDMKMIGNCMMIATTKKFGKSGDYLYVHFTNGFEMACIKIDEKDETTRHGANYANSWGHWAGDKLSIVELIVNSNPPNNPQLGSVKVDYIINCGNYVNNPNLAKSDLIQYVKSKTSKKGNESNWTNTSTNSIGGKAVQWAINHTNDHGYSYGYGADGPKQYDCSHFVYRAFRDGAGIDLEYASTGSLASVYQKYGFKVLAASQDNSKILPYKGMQLQAGDILLRSDHVDICVNQTTRVGAHTSATGIYVDNIKKSYSCILRYVGK